MSVKHFRQSAWFLLSLALMIPVTISDAFAVLNCSFTASDFNFGNIDLTANTNFYTTVTITATCSGGASHQTLSMCSNLPDGTGGSTTGGVRYIENGMNQLTFNVYKDASYSNIVGDYFWSHAPTPILWTGQTNRLGNFNGSTTLYAKIDAGQTTLPAGVYTSDFTGVHNITTWYRNANRTCAELENDQDGTSSTDSHVSANHTGTCVVSASNLNFGSVGLLSSNVDAATTLSVTCTNGLPHTIQLDGGLSGANDPTQRKMTSGGSEVTYGLYLDSSRSLSWGDENGGQYLSETGTGLAQSHHVYGRVPSQPTPPVGTYSDTVVVTVTY